MVGAFRSCSPADDKVISKENERESHENYSSIPVLVQKIPVRITHRVSNFQRKLNAKPRQLRTLQHCPEHIQMENQSFPVPKSLFINICNLKKTKNRVQASVALEADLIMRFRY
jgi:hypothetical protein